MSEVNFLAFFEQEAAARRAVRELKQRKFDVVQLDRISPFPGRNASDLDNPISEPIGSLATEVLEANVEGPDAEVLAAAHPDASGMADGEGHQSMENWLVTVIAPHERHEEAKQVLKRYGARL